MGFPSDRARTARQTHGRGRSGRFVNAHNIIRLSQEPEWAERLAELDAIPTPNARRNSPAGLGNTPSKQPSCAMLALSATSTPPTGKRQIVKGKDLTAVRWLVGTGGALTRIPGGGEEILRDICRGGAGKYLLPNPDTRV